jgi:HK97 family phage major capsid protein
MESKIPFQGNKPGFVMSSKTYMGLKSIRDNAGWVFRSQLDNFTLHGFPVWVTDAFSSSNFIIFGLFNQFYFGVETDLQLDMDQPNFAADLVMYRAIQRNDWALRHTKAFAVLTGVTY